MKKSKINLDGIVHELTDKDLELLEHIKKNNISPVEALKLFDDKPKQYHTVNLGISDKRVKFGVVSDPHIGSTFYRPDIMEHAGKMFDKEKVDFVLMPGDILEGMSGRDGQIFELTHIGATRQLNYAVEELSKIKCDIMAITATNSHDGWYSGKGNMGFEVGPALEEKLQHFKFLGYDEVDVKLANGCILRMIHPGGGTAYAQSYKIQKYINALPGGRKPNALFSGHYHKSLYMFYRNIHAFESGTLEETTTFMKKMGTSAALGYWIIDLWIGSKGGINQIQSKFVPFYEK